ncbi:eukaryotic translation initiation factor 3 subunit 7 (eIF-3) domain-containing protein [Ditylenchus destructor]|nr:eukaryotic translation initiation factor 3 subunit 7 (eIF-3) domain-containing protein [Ditylenchus destructor]
MTSNSLPAFDLPTFPANPNGWGPNPANSKITEEFDGLPFQQFNKCDRIGRIVDWLGVERYYKKGDTRDRYNERMYGSSATAGTQFDYVHDNEDANFQLVDSSKPQKQQKPFRRQFQFRRGGMFGQKEQDRRDTFNQSNKMKRSIAKEQMRAYKQWQRRGAGKNRQPSIQVRADWKILEELDFQRLSKLLLPNVEPGADIPGENYGTLHFYDKAIDKVTVKTQTPLQKCGGTFYNITTTDDPVIEKLSQSHAGNVFATDTILATIMAASRSVNSWDIVVQKIGSTLFFDKRINSENLISNPIDALYVSESATEPPSFETPGINNANDLATEALYINQNFRRQVLKRADPGYKCEHEKAPFEDDARAECAYRYRIWSLGNMSDGTPIKVVARTENDGVILGANGEIQKLTIKAFNEWDSGQSGGVDWRAKIDSQKGAVLATEMKNNSCKLAKWTLQAILGGSDYIKFGFVSRVNVRNSAQHVILGTQQVKPLDFANNITMNLDNCWGILRTIIDFFMKQPQGKYLMLKDPLQPVVRIYALPEGTFDSSGEDESEEETGSEGEAE